MTSIKETPAAFTDMLVSGYGGQEPALVLGAALEGSVVHQQPLVRLPLATVNRSVMARRRISRWASLARVGATASGGGSSSGAGASGRRAASAVPRM